jgi:hypothetical protein
MGPGESNLHSFIIKVWLEDASRPDNGPAWRARITHVPGGEQRYLNDLDDIPSFIRTTLGQRGVRPRVWVRMKRWFRGHREHFQGQH